MVVVRWFVVAVLALSVGAGSCAPELGIRTDFLISFELADATGVETLSVEVRYTGGGIFCGKATAVRCSPGTGWLKTTFNDDDSAATLQIDVERSGVSASDTFASCTFSADVAPTDGNFTIDILDATDSNGDAIAPADLTADVASIEDLATTGSCEGTTTSTTSSIPTSTTTSSTSTVAPTVTTVPRSTTTVPVSSTSSTSMSTVPQSTTTSTTTTLPGSAPLSYDLTFGIVAPATPLGAVQFNVDYVNAGGDFKGSGEAVVCKKAAGFSALEAFSDCDTPGGCPGQGGSTIPEKRLSLAFADNSSFTPPRDLAVCVFQKSGSAPVTADFTISIVDASTTSGTPVAAAVVLSSIVPCACGDGQVNCVEENCDSGAASVTATCGDGSVNCSQCTSEECDDGNAVSGDGCSSSCTCENICGDGVLEAPCEQCDPGYECQFGAEPAGTACTPPDAPECNAGGFCLDVAGDSCNPDCTTAP